MKILLVEDDSRLAQAYFLRGLGYTFTGDKTKALSDLNKAAELSQQQGQQQLYQKVMEAIRQLGN